MEWLFFVTKPSFMDGLSLGESLRILIHAGLPLVAIAAAYYALLLPFWRRKLATFLFAAPIVATLSASALLLFDNFTYTLFAYGIKNSEGMPRYAYSAALAAAAILIFRSVDRIVHRRLIHARPSNRLLAVVASGVLIGLASTSLQTLLSTHPEASSSPTTREPTALPNIILFASDGVEADRLTIYGAERETAPNLTSLASTALVFENAFSNAGKSIAATTAMLTGKHPLTTRVLDTNHLLRERDAYEHLPGLLKAHGYISLQETLLPWLDSFHINMRNSFDRANGRRVGGPLPIPGRIKDGLGFELMFLDQVFSRARERVLHVAHVRDMEDVHAQLVGIDESASLWHKKDEIRIDRALEFMESATQPFFVHLHLITETHCAGSAETPGCNFYPSISRFSAEPDATVDDRYDDAIVGSDQHFGRLLDWLRESGRLDDTIIVYHSDHGREWDSKLRIPLVFSFPSGDHAGRVRANVSLLDVAPTLLDYLGIVIPSYMEGRSLIRPLEPREIFTVPHSSTLKEVTMIACHRWYTLELESHQVLGGEVSNHTARCHDAEDFSTHEVRERILRFIGPSSYR